MNYEPNTTHWKKGDLVIHDADSKEPKMLMVVVGYTRDGYCKTEYVNRQYHKGHITGWENRLAVLHDPMRFRKTAAYLQDEQP